MKKALDHLTKSDPVMAAIIKRVGPFKMAYRDPVFQMVVRAIVFQQLSTKAAGTIYNRFEAAAGGALTPESILNLSIGDMRRVGLSKQKIAYIRDLADQTLEGDLDFEELVTLPDDEIIARLTAVKGIGLWTAQMFLIFSLKRPNVLPTGDLGIKSAIKRAYKKRYKTKDGYPTAAHIEKIAKCWHPYCSVASWYLWRSLDHPAEP